MTTNLLIEQLVEPWMDDARCHGYDSLFAPEKASPTSAASRRALRRCAMCPVRAECLRWGLSNVLRWPIPVYAGSRLDWLVVEHPMASSEAIFGGTTLFDRAEVSGLPLAEQERRLREGFRARALGRSPLVTSGEWIETAPVEARGAA